MVTRTDQERPIKCVVAGCIIVDGGRTLLMNHESLGVWLNPGGHVEAGETPLETAVREVKEETGLDVEVVSRPQAIGPLGDALLMPAPFVTLLETVRYAEGTHEHFDVLYLARPKDPAQVPRGNEESRELRWFTVEELSSIRLFDNTKAALVAALDAANLTARKANIV